MKAPKIKRVVFDEGSSTDAFHTGDNTLKIEGTGPAGAKIILFADGVKIGATKVDKKGKWSFDTGPLADGVHTFRVKAKIGKDTSPLSNDIQGTIDATAPSPPAATLSTASDTGQSNADNVTSDSTPTLTGSAESGATIIISDGGTVIGTTVANGSGQWSFTTGPLAGGVHSFSATATDASGNTSAASAPLTVVIDTFAPTSPARPSLDASDTGQSNVDNVTSDNTPTLTGSAEPGATIAIGDGGTVIGTTVANGSGRWSFTTGPLADGAHSFSATATDAAGNTSAASAPLTVIIDRVSPSAPVITGYAEDTDVPGDGITTVSELHLAGSAEAGATVAIFDGATSLGVVVTDPTGTWEFPTGTLAAGSHRFTARAVDAAGNTSPASVALEVNIAAFTLTAGDDSIAMPSSGGYVVGIASTLTAGDSLVGGAGRDVLALLGDGTFRLDLLAAFSAFDEVQLHDPNSGFASIALPDNADVTVTSMSTGITEFILGDSAATTITVAGTYSIFILGSGQEHITGGGGADRFRIEDPNDLTIVDVLDGGGGSDALEFFLPDGATFDLRSGFDLTSIELLFFYSDGGDLLIDQSSLAGFTEISGSETARVVTAAATLDLSGVRLSSIKAESSNASGTVFTVDNATTAVQVLGGQGMDTLRAPTLALSEAQRNTIFFFGSVETIVDSEGTHTHPFAGAVRLTEEADSVDLREGGGLILGDSSTLNPADALDGGNGHDVLALFGGGVFRLDQLTAFTGFDALQLVNLVSGSASLWLPEDCAIDLALTGDGVEVVVGDGYSGSITSDAFMAQFSLGSGSSATIVATAGDTNTFVLGDNSTLTITATGRHNEFVIGDNATTTITATGSSGSFYLGSGRETITGGSGTDRFRVEGVGDLAADDMLDGGEGTDDAVEITLPDGSTFDLTAGIVLMNIDRLSFYCADGVLLMSQASLAGLSQLGGAATARMITGEATLDLSGMSVSDIKIASSHADGTVFTVDSVAAALQVFGGPGEDTISAPELTFTAEELEAIFLGGSIEIVRDASGNHTSGGSGNFEPGLLLA